MEGRSVLKRLLCDRLILRLGGRFYFLRIISTQRVMILTIRIPNSNKSEYVTIESPPLQRVTDRQAEILFYILAHMDPRMYFSFQPFRGRSFTSFIRPSKSPFPLSRRGLLLLFLSYVICYRCFTSIVFSKSVNSPY